MKTGVFLNTIEISLAEKDPETTQTDMKPKHPFFGPRPTLAKRCRANALQRSALITKCNEEGQKRAAHNSDLQCTLHAAGIATLFLLSRIQAQIVNVQKGNSEYCFRPLQIDCA
jgi:hypothetical protein